MGHPDAASTAAPDNPWGDTVATPDAGDDWMGAPPHPWTRPRAWTAPTLGFALHQLWDGSLPVESWINQGWTGGDEFPSFLPSGAGPIDGVLTQMEGLLQSVPPLWMVAILSLLAWQCAGRGVGIGAAVSLLLVAMLGIWPEAMVTLSLVLTSLAFCLASVCRWHPVGAQRPAQRWMPRSWTPCKPRPPLSIWLPVVMLFGIGNVPGVVVTIVFALPPLVRLTNLAFARCARTSLSGPRPWRFAPGKCWSRCSCRWPCLPSWRASTSR